MKKRRRTFPCCKAGTLCVADLRRQRLLDDEELDSGDDLERQDRVDEEVGAAEQQYETQEKTTMDIEMARQPLPEPSDGEVCVSAFKHDVLR